MVVTDENIEEIKAQILQQTKHLPEEQRAEIEEQINSMSAEELELFVKDQMSRQTSAKGVYRMIIDGEIPAKKIYENGDFVCAVEIKPITKGHLIIIPKKAAGTAKDIPASAFEYAKEISDKIVNELGAKGVEIQSEFKFAEAILNIIPVYDKPVTTSSPRYDASEEELAEVYEKLKDKPKPVVIKKEHLVKEEGEVKSEIVKLKRKIP